MTATFQSQKYYGARRTLKRLERQKRIAAGVRPEDYIRAPIVAHGARRPAASDEGVAAVVRSTTALGGLLLVWLACEAWHAWWWSLAALGAVETVRAVVLMVTLPLASGALEEWVDG